MFVHDLNRPIGKRGVWGDEGKRSEAFESL